MAQRYFVAIALPQHIQQILHNLSQQATGKPSPVLFPHISLIPPFTLKDKVTEENVAHIVSEIKITPFSANLGSIDVFHQHGRTLLITYVESNDIFEEHNTAMTTILAPFIIIDTTPYTDGVVPKFRAHTTIDYDAKLQPKDEDRVKKLPSVSATWEVNSFELYKEVGPGKWEKVEAS